MPELEFNFSIQVHPFIVIHHNYINNASIIGRHISDFCQTEKPHAESKRHILSQTMRTTHLSFKITPEVSSQKKTTEAIPLHL